MLLPTLDLDVKPLRCSGVLSREHSFRLRSVALESSTNGSVFEIALAPFASVAAHVCA